MRLGKKYCNTGLSAIFQTLRPHRNKVNRVLNFRCLCHFHRYLILFLALKINRMDGKLHLNAAYFFYAGYLNF